MNAIRVWAPNAQRVAVQLDGRRLAMEKEGGEARGWWRLRSAEATAGADYAFIIDDDERPLPDPRSPWQPQGVHSPSRIVDHDAFTWTDGDFAAPALSDAIIYELHIGTFTAQGTFESAIARLDHLVELGVTHVELMPVPQFPGARGWGYDGVDLFAPHQAYGGPLGLKRLVDACHGKGLAVLLDVVYNHFGPSGNYLPRFGPYLTDRYATPWGSAVNFDGRGSDEVRRFVCDNAIGWMRDYHIDGLRLDAVHAIMDASPTPLLEQLSAETAELSRRTGRRRVLIAEDDHNDPRITTPTARGGYGIDAQWDEDFHHALHTVLTGESSGYYADFGALGQFAKSLRHAFVYDGEYSVYRDRHQGRSAAGLAGHNFVGCLQNHDQTGNRARGERSSHLMSPGGLRIGAAMLLTAPFVPMLFQGEEWGASTPFQYFTDHQEPELARAVSEGRTREFAAFGWKPEEIPDPQDPATFERSKLDWSQMAREPHQSILRWYRRLIELRSRFPELRDGKLDRVEVSYDEQARWLVMTRAPISVALNLDQSSRTVPLEGLGSRRLLMASDELIVLTTEAVNLPPDSVAIIGPA
ncbi:MAG TPA: malto-oligosyltrehalose trehalohydrolase [Candidatus Binataceae bacterium]|jgi:maltooligosyltrehalose trehalohydrolase|nr:malto-oligosyltrehalose trehalohydrolase [Candidatus Binataceae bacterium]